MLYLCASQSILVGIIFNSNNMLKFTFTLHFADDCQPSFESASFETLVSLRRFYHKLYKQRHQRPAFCFYLEVSHPDFGLLFTSGTHAFNDYSNLRFCGFASRVYRCATSIYVNKFLKVPY